MAGKAHRPAQLAALFGPCTCSIRIETSPDATGPSESLSAHPPRHGARSVVTSAAAAERDDMDRVAMLSAGKKRRASCSPMSGTFNERTNSQVGTGTVSLPAHSAASGAPVL